jgi:hypothetical protein
MIDENLYQGYLKALLAGQRAECHATVQGLLDSGIEIKELYDHLFQRSLYQGSSSFQVDLRSCWIGAASR